MKLPVKSNHFFTLAGASVLTRNFRQHAAPGAIKGGLFWKEALRALVDQPECVAMRYYYGREDSGKPVLVLVGVDAQGRDMTHGILLEASIPCPPFCDAPNGLNFDKSEVQRISNIMEVSKV